jgi:hypothetical protein
MIISAYVSILVSLIIGAFNMGAKMHSAIGYTAIGFFFLSIPLALIACAAQYAHDKKQRAARMRYAR